MEAAVATEPRQDDLGDYFGARGTLVALAGGLIGLLFGWPFLGIGIGAGVGVTWEFAAARRRAAARKAENAGGPREAG